MSDNLPDFLIQLGKEAQALPANLVVTTHRVLHLEALRRVVQKTPVDVGTARANWQSTLEAPAAGHVAVRSAEEVNAEGARVIAGVKPYTASFITNNSDHIEILELGGFVPPDPGPSKDPRKGRKGRVLVQGGYSVQAPHGMVGVTVEELRDAQVE